MKRELTTRFTGEDKRLRAAAAYEMIVSLLPYMGATNVEWKYEDVANGGRIVVTWTDGIDVMNVIPMIKRAMDE
jgi:hypothetical protein